MKCDAFGEGTKLTLELTVVLCFRSLHSLFMPVSCLCVQPAVPIDGVCNQNCSFSESQADRAVQTMEDSAEFSLSLTVVPLLSFEDSA